MLEKINSDKLIFKPLSQEEKEKRGILGRLSGPIATCACATRNKRFYSDKLWEKAFENPLVKEMFAQGGLPGELDHPTDRDETDSSRIAVMMPEPPKKNDKGQLIAILDIVNTPCGQIAYQLAKYGFHFGISSRGQGDVEPDYEGIENVDPDTYDLKAFDIVLLPSYEKARLQFTESLDTSKPSKSLTEALKECIDNCTSDDDKEIMKKTLNELEISYSSDSENEKEQLSEEVDNIDTESLSDEVTNEAAEDTGAETMEALQEALRQNAELENKIKVLQEQLSVCYTKEARYSATLGRANTQLQHLSSTNEELVNLNENLKTQVKTLQSDLKTSEQSNKSLNEQISNVNLRLQEGVSSKTSLTETVNSLKSDLKKKDTTIKSLQEALSTSNANYEKLEKSSSAEIKSLKENLIKVTKDQKLIQEQLDETLRDSKIIKSRATAQQTQSRELIEKYKTIAKTAVDKYIVSQASRLGIKAEEIKSRLNETYSFKDIDQVCESLQQYKLNINSLPFSPNQHIKAKITESKKPTITTVTEDNSWDDNIDETLKSFM